MDDKRSALFGKFREEVDTHLLSLQKNLVALEDDPKNSALLKEIFRSAHTIKGAAKMMGFAQIAAVTHQMEEVLGVMRDGRLDLNSEISDRLFEGIEVITALTELQANPDNPQAQSTLESYKPEVLTQQFKEIADSVKEEKEEPESGGASAAPVAVPATPPPADGGPRPAPAPVAEPEPARNASEAGKTSGPIIVDAGSIRVPVHKIDTLMNLSGEMIITKMQHTVIGDRLLALLEMERSRIRHLGSITETVERSWGAINQADMESTLAQLHQLDSQIDEMTAQVLREFQEYASRLNTVADELQDTVLGVRMLPVSTLFDSAEITIRTLRRTSGKDFEAIFRGGETELDKQIVDALEGPLNHLLRNAVDHGIEKPAVRQAAGKPPKGRISIQAFQQGTQVVISITDDGGGMDPDRLRRTAVQKGLISRAEADKLTDSEALNLIFHAGFTTAEIITDVSGRGVGMDAVKTVVERNNGTVIIDESRLSMGTRISMRLPLTLATMQALLVRVASQIFVLPSHTIEGSMEYIGLDDIITLENHEVVRLGGRTIPLIRLEELLDLSRVESGNWIKDTGLQNLLLTSTNGNGHGPLPAGPDLDGAEDDVLSAFQTAALRNGIHLENKLPGIIVGSGERQACFLVDELIDELDVVVKSLGPLLGHVSTAIGATILGDGRVVIILDVPSLLAEARNRSNRGPVRPAWRAGQANKKPYILVVDDSITTRELEKSILENAGFDVDIAMDGMEALGKLEVQFQGGGKHYDLVIADIEMPRMDGLELTQRIKTHDRDALRAMPVIIVSSLASEAYKQRGVEVGAQAYMTKGQFDQSHLLETIDLLIQ